MPRRRSQSLEEGGIEGDKPGEAQGDSKVAEMNADDAVAAMSLPDTVV